MIVHGAACRLRTDDPVLVDQLLSNYRIAELEPKERTMLDFAVKVANAAHLIETEDIDALREVGWTDEDIFHMIELAAMFSFTGRLANTLGLVANHEYSEMGRGRQARKTS